MKKNIKNFISIGVLIFVMCALIVSVKTINKTDSTLSSSNNNLNEEIKNNVKFEYKSARESLNENIIFENNFGGENTDEVNAVYKLENYYLIGTTNSKEYYFNSIDNTALFILICNYNGKAIKVNTINLNYEVKYIAEIFYGNSFYILVKTNLYNVIKFDLTTNELKTIYTSTSKNCEIINSTEPIILETEENTTTLHYLIQNKKQTFNHKIEKTYLACEYLNGTLLFYLENNNVYIATIINNKLNIIKEFLNSKLETFTINEENLVLVLNENNKIKLEILDLFFNKETTVELSTGNNFNLIYNNNTYHLFYKNNNNLFVTTFCKHGDIFFNKKITQQEINNYNILLLNNNFVVLTEELNKITITIYNLIFENKQSTELYDSFKITYFNANNNGTTIIGNVENNKSTIKQNYGKKDIFILELKKLNGWNNQPFFITKFYRTYVWQIIILWYNN